MPSPGPYVISLPAVPCGDGPAFQGLILIGRGDGLSAPADHIASGDSEFMVRHVHPI